MPDDIRNLNDVRSLPEAARQQAQTLGDGIRQAANAARPRDARIADEITRDTTGAELESSRYDEDYRRLLEALVGKDAGAITKATKALAQDPCYLATERDETLSAHAYFDFTKQLSEKYHTSFYIAPVTEEEGNKLDGLDKEYRDKRKTLDAYVTDALREAGLDDTESLIGLRALNQTAPTAEEILAQEKAQGENRTNLRSSCYIS